jgi:hypothetical protein
MGWSFPAAAVDIRLVDARTGKAIADAEVRVSSDNGIRCIRAPCPTGFKEWNGRSDSSGTLSVPDTAFNADTRFQVQGYEPTASLPREAAKASNWQVELDPKDSNMEGGMRIDRVKLIDKTTGKPLSNVSFWVASSRNCRSRTCTDVVLSGATNTLGNAFVPLARIPNLEQRMWIGVEGHQAVEYGRFPEDMAVLPGLAK